MRGPVTRGITTILSGFRRHAVRLDQELPRTWDECRGGRVQLHAGLHELAGDHCSRGATEHHKGRRFGRDDEELEALDLHLAGALGGHQCKLVYRERVGGPFRQDERDASRVAILEILGHALVDLSSLGVSEDEDVVDVSGRATTDCDQQGVVRQPFAFARVCDSVLEVHLGKSALDPGSIAVLCYVLERIPACFPEASCLGYEKRPVHEPVVRRNEPYLNRVARQGAQSQQPLDPGDTSPADDNTEIAQGRSPYLVATKPAPSSSVISLP
jgi:hypothetical protein